MDCYSVLIQRICNIPQLMDKIQEWMQADDCLNLVSDERQPCVDWKSKLESSLLYQTFHNDAKDLFNLGIQSGAFKIQQMKEINLSKKVIVAGMCQVYNTQKVKSQRPDKVPFGITIHECKPLDLLGLALTSDVDRNTIQLSDTVKVDFNSCSLVCKYCSTAANEIKMQNIDLQFENAQPCILDIDIYDGNHLGKSFGFQLKKLFPGMFFGILVLELESRYFYPKLNDNTNRNVRIGGKVLSMVAFPESNLMDKPKINLSNLQLFSCMKEQNPEKRPAAEMIEEDDKDEVINIKKRAVPKNIYDEVDVVEESIVFN